MMYIHVCTWYTCDSIQPRLQYIWISSGLSRCSLPTLGLSSEYSTCIVCVSVHTRTHSLIPPVKRGDLQNVPKPNFISLPPPKPNPCAGKSDNHRSIEKSWLSLSFYTRMQWRNIAVGNTCYSAKNTCWAHLCEEKIATTKCQWMKRMAVREARQQRCADIDVNVDGPVLLLRLAKSGHVKLPSILQEKFIAGGLASKS